MDIDLAALPDDVAALQRLVRDLAAVRESERTGLAEAQAEIERLRLIVQKLQAASLAVAPIVAAPRGLLAIPVKPSVIRRSWVGCVSIEISMVQWK